MDKLTITNRKGQKLVVILDQTENARGLAFVAHGLSGNKDQPHIVTFAEALKEKGYTVVRFDTTNTFGESYGRYEDATATSYYEDLEDIITWAQTQPWYREPFCLAGHSLGGLTTILYAERFPQKIKGLAPTSAVISGKLSAEARGEEKMEQWQKTGWEEEKSANAPGGIKRLPWSHMVDRLTYDVLPEAKKLTMPVLLIVGDKDTSTPPTHQQIFYDHLPGKKELHIIKNAEHTFIKPDHLAEIKQIFLTWIDTLH